ncbi:hypothetical protein C8J27_101610 [Rhodobacter aestuarii]|uniref:Uncharacterized protein n=1 Tax=Rhodobacter aestuarii TaxID=453582 RepID=A0A1N7IVE4_9RHOB|nr:hypothetical protein [Rhodobacter aestuarii]PTV97494.1 hypothetical protein C8J27_101610 [Rhodobacter aestuarii]SIS40996.1 hypothetical protein SAMN05421580_10132 [Rhodobacter aestuarii]
MIKNFTDPLKITALMLPFLVLFADLSGMSNLTLGWGPVIVLTIGLLALCRVLDVMVGADDRKMTPERARMAIWVFLLALDLVALIFAMMQPGLTPLVIGLAVVFGFVGILGPGLKKRA